MNAPHVYIELAPASLQLRAGDAGLEVPLRRLDNGRLDSASREKLVSSVREFLKQQGVRPGAHAFCAIGARGVSLRRLTLPAASKDELQRLLVLQIEREFPLPPDELAWGYCPVAPQARTGNGADKVQELLVVAVKREALQEYADLLADCGLTPRFTLAALARSHLVPPPLASCAVLEIGRSQSELITFENGAAGSLRVIPWGDDKLSSEGGLQTLAGFLRGNVIGSKLYITGAAVGLKSSASQLGNLIGRGVECELIDVNSSAGQTAAILGLTNACEERRELPLTLELGTPSHAEPVARPTPWKWAALACALLFVSVALRYAEAVVQKPRLARRIAEMKNYRDSLPKVDRELGFLQYLKTNQPPYLDSLFVMANAAAPGSRIETISMNRRGDLALRASMRDSQQVGDFRSKLIGSGAFTVVTVDEQTPTPDKQKVLVRMTGQWKPLSERKAPATPVSNLETEKARSAAQTSKLTATNAVATKKVQE